MADQLLPPWLKIARLRTDYLDNTGMTRALYTRAPETTGFGGDGLRLSLEFVPTSSRQTPVERAAIRSFLASLRGRQNRAYLWDPSYRQRGSFPAGEMLTNGTFANGTAGWVSNNGAVVSISVADRTLRLRRAANTGSPPTVLGTSAAAVLYAPYVAMAFAKEGRGAMRWDLRIRDISDLAVYATSATSVTTPGLLTCAGVPRDTDMAIGIVDRDGSKIAGDYMDITYASLSRCALVDNGQNLLLQSDEFDTTWTPTRATVDDQTSTAPDGTVTGDALVEDGTAANSHFVSQSIIVASTAADFSFAGAFRAENRTWVNIRIQENTGGTSCNASFNLSTGALGTVVSSANMTNARGFIVSLGNGWYYCCIVGRKANAATSLTAIIAAAEGDSDITFDGVNLQLAISMWRATLAQSSVPTRLVQTTTTALASGTNQTGSALYIKGGRAPGEGALSGALLPDDRFEIITSRGSEMKIVTAPLDFDAAGQGYLQFEPPLKGIPADNAPIIIVNPMTRAIFAGDMVGWDDSPGILTTASAEFEEA